MGSQTEANSSQKLIDSDPYVPYDATTLAVLTIVQPFQAGL